MAALYDVIQANSHSFAGRIFATSLKHSFPLLLGPQVIFLGACFSLDFLLLLLCTITKCRKDLTIPFVVWGNTGCTPCRSLIQVDVTQPQVVDQLWVLGPRNIRILVVVKVL